MISPFTIGPAALSFPIGTSILDLCLSFSHGSPRPPRQTSGSVANDLLSGTSSTEGRFSLLRSISRVARSPWLLTFTATCIRSHDSTSGCSFPGRGPRHLSYVSKGTGGAPMSKWKREVDGYLGEPPASNKLMTLPTAPYSWRQYYTCYFFLFRKLFLKVLQTKGGKCTTCFCSVIIQVLIRVDRF